MECCTDYPLPEYNRDYSQQSIGRTTGLRHRRIQRQPAGQHQSAPNPALRKELREEKKAVPGLGFKQGKSQRAPIDLVPPQS